MRISSLKVTTLVAAIILAEIIGVSSGTLIVSYIIRSSGSISYGPIQTRPLHTEGRYIKNDLGQTVILRGFNKQDFVDTSSGMWTQVGGNIEDGAYYWDPVAVRQHMQHWRDFWKMNVVRFHSHVQWWKQNTDLNYWSNSKVGIGFRDAIKQTIQIAYEEGIYVVYDFFTTKPGVEQEDQPYPPYSNTGVVTDRQAFVNLWVDVATQLGQFPNVIYELWNEPGGDMATWFETATQCINAIRALGDDHLILVQYGFCGELNYVYEWEKQGRPTANIVFGMHNYRWHGSFEDKGGERGLSSPTDYEYIRNYLWRSNGAPKSVVYPNTGTAQSTDRYMYPPTGSNYGEVLTELNGGKGYPVWIGEVAPHGEGNDVPDAEYTYFVNVLRVFKEWELGWAHFVWDAPWGEWPAQILTRTVFQPPNRVGQAMIDSITQG